MMIYLSSSLLVNQSPQETHDLNNPLIGYKSVIAAGTVEASSEAAGKPAVNLANPATDLVWQAETISDQVIEISNPGNQQIDYVAFARWNNESALSAIVIEGYTGIDETSLPVWEELIPDHIPGANRPALYRFEKKAYAGIRVHFRNNLVKPGVGVLFCGELTVMERRIHAGHAPFSLNRKSQVQSGVSESGEYLGRIVTRISRETTAAFSNVTPGWYRAHMEPFAEAGLDTPFFWAWRPHSYPDEVGFAWLTSDPRPTNSLPNGLMSFEIAMQGID